MATAVRTDNLQKARKLIEREIETLIALLDAIDGDPDLEPDEVREDGALDNPVPIYGDDQTGSVIAWTGGRGAALEAFRHEPAYRDRELANLPSYRLLRPLNRPFRPGFGRNA